MRLRTGLPAFIAVLLTGISCHAAAEYPRLSRSLMWEKYKYDAGTYALFHLDAKAPAEQAEISLEAVNLEDDGDELLLGDEAPSGGAAAEGEVDLTVAKNAVPGGKDGALRGAAAFCADGFLGGALRLQGGGDGLFCSGLQPGAGWRTVEFWLRLASYPESAAVLVEHVAPLRRAPQRYQAAAWNAKLRGMTLLLNADGTLAVDLVKERWALDGVHLPLDRWVHLSFSVTNAWPQHSAVHLFLNGRLAGARTIAPHYAGLIAQHSQALFIGTGAAGTRGLEALLDEVRLSRVYRDYYAWDLAWPQERQGEPVPAGPPYLRSNDDLLFHLDCNGTTKPRHMAPGTKYPDHTVTEADLELNPKKVAATFPPGVEGRGMMLGQGSVRPVYGAKGNLDPMGGTIAFWLQPVDWDNYTRDNKFDNINPTTFGLFQLDCTTVEGSNEAVYRKVGPLLQFSVPLHLPAERDNPVPFAPGEWAHLCMTWEKGDFTYYINGKPRAPDGAFNPHLEIRTQGDPYPYRKANARWWYESTPVRLRFTENRYWEQRGMPMPKTVIDDFRIYRRPLAPSEVANLAARLDPRATVQKLPPADMQMDYNGVVGTVDVKLIPLMAEYEKAASATVVVVKEGDAEPVGTATLAFDARKQGGTTVETPPLEFATYQVRANVLDEAGHSLGQVEQSFTRVAPPWWGCKAGVSDKAMPEWEPVTIADRTVKVAVRAIELAPSGLPAKVVSQGEDVLAGPVALAAVAGGQAVSLAPGALQWREQKEGWATWEGRLSGKAFDVVTRGRIEFDGMMWFDLALEPKGEGVTLDGLTLTLPYAATATKLLHWWSGNRAFRNYKDPRGVYIGRLPAGAGTIFRSNDNDLVLRAPKIRGSFIPYVMLTGMERGMAWFAENDSGWTQSMETPAVSLVKRGEGVDLVLRMITERVVLEGNRTISFGLHPTPVRALEPNWRMRPDGITFNFPDTFTGNNLKGEKGSTAFNVYPTDSDWDAVRRRIDGEGLTKGAAGLQGLHQRFRESFEEKYGRAPTPVEEVVPGLYWDLQHLDGFPAHSREWVAVWRPRGDCSNYTPELNDFLAWCWRDWIVKTDKFVRGAYIDDCWGSPQVSAVGHCSYTLPDGHVQPGYQFRGWRERIKRMRQISWDLGLVPRLTSHTTHTYLIPYHSFFDAILDGEDYYSKPPRQSDFIDHWGLDRMQFMHHDKWGLITIWLGWCGNSLDTDKYPAWTYRQTRAYKAHLAQHDIDWPFGAVEHKLGLRRPDTKFFPYWAEDPVATSSLERVKVTVWKQEKGCLVLLTNVGGERAEVAVTFDLAALGLPADAAMAQRDPGLLTYFSEDNTTVEALDVNKDTQAGADLVGGGAPSPADDEALDAEALGLEEGVEDLSPEERRAQDPDGKFTWEAPVLQCPVRRHDYRLFLLKP